MWLLFLAICLKKNVNKKTIDASVKEIGSKQFDFLKFLQTYRQSCVHHFNDNCTSVELANQMPRLCHVSFIDFWGMDNATWNIWGILFNQIFYPNCRIKCSTVVALPIYDCIQRVFRYTFCLWYIDCQYDQGLTACYGH